MAKFKIASSITKNQKLWRYMPLDALIYLLDKKKLYFSLLSAFEDSDPGEGYPPMVAMQAIASISAKGFAIPEGLLEQFRVANSYLPEDELKAASADFEQKLKLIHDEHKRKLVRNYNLITKKIAVNCWHKNEVESEAMWRIYSSKGIAIVSSINSIEAALAENTQDATIFTGNVKYLDYHDENLEPKDCLSDGFIAPLIKSSHYSHEREFRLFMSPKYISPEQIDDPEKEIDILPNALIEQVIISPYAKEPFISSVSSICSIYGIQVEKVKASKLLQSYSNRMQELLDDLM